MMKTQAHNISTFKVAAAYIGTVVGAGFASGQEVLQFFGFFGISGILALLVATAMFVFFGLIVLDLGHRLNADSHREIMRHAGGKWVGTIVDGVIIFFLFGGLTAMAAGSGAIFEEQFNFSYVLGSLIMVTATVLTVLLGVSGVINAISFVVPVLLLSVIGISAATFITTPFSMETIGAITQPARAPVPFWPLSAVIYVSYNLVLGVSVLGPLGKHVDNPNTLKKGALYGGIGLGIGALLIHLTLIVNGPRVAGYEIPMVFIAAQFSPLIQIAYSVVLLAEIYTTAVGSLYGFVERITDEGKAAFKWLTIGAGAAAFAASQFGFSTLVRTLYPAVGFAGLIMLGGLLYGYTREKLIPQPAFKRED
ncbi:MAG: hypothetical protein H0Z40_10560 [Desulfotomaculum sp.]|nr:hypothetical protein [Desulfotomaculum sp.]